MTQEVISHAQSSEAELFEVSGYPAPGFDTANGTIIYFPEHNLASYNFLTDLKAGVASQLQSAGETNSKPPNEGIGQAINTEHVFHLPPIPKKIDDMLKTADPQVGVTRSDLKRISECNSMGAFSYQLSTLKTVLEKYGQTIVNLVPKGHGEPRYILGEIGEDGKVTPKKPQPKDQVGEIKEPVHKPLKLTEVDIIRITTYRSEDYLLTSVEKRALAECLAGEIPAFTPEEVKIMDLSKVNRLVLRDTGLSLRRSPNNDFTQYRVLVDRTIDSNSPDKDKKDKAKMITERLRFLDYRSKNPPFMPSYEKVGSKLNVWISKLGKPQTEPQSLRTYVFDMFGNPIEPGVNTESATDKKRGVYSVRPSDQIRLIQILFINPSIKLSEYRKLFSQTANSVQLRPDNEHDMIMKLTDRILTKWGLAISITKDPEDKDSDIICSLVPYDNTHVEPDLGYVFVDLEAEQAALPQRQRRRQPYTGKLRL